MLQMQQVTRESLVTYFDNVIELVMVCSECCYSSWNRRNIGGVVDVILKAISTACEEFCKFGKYFRVLNVLWM